MEERGEAATEGVPARCSLAPGRSARPRPWRLLVAVHRARRAELAERGHRKGRALPARRTQPADALR